MRNEVCVRELGRGGCGSSKKSVGLTSSETNFGEKPSLNVTSITRNPLSLSKAARCWRNNDFPVPGMAARKWRSGRT